MTVTGEKAQSLLQVRFVKAILGLVTLLSNPIAFEAFGQRDGP